MTRIHHLYIRNDIFKPKKYKRKSSFDEETLEWLNQRSNRNILIQNNGNMKKLTTNQAKALREWGLIYGRYGSRELTPRGLELLREIKNEGEK